MKRLLMICYIILLFSYCFPHFAERFRKEADAPESGVQTVYVSDGGETRELDMAEYLTGVVAAEMPASFETEALKAQAVAARSYTMYCMMSGKHGTGQVCTSSGCCQAYLTEEQMLARWGTGYEKYRGKISAAVAATDGEYLSYMGKPAQAVFHSSSAPLTEDSGNVWGAVPYLVSVSSPESAETVPDYISYVYVSPEDFKKTVLSVHPEAVFPENKSQWIGEISRDGSGRVKSVDTGGTRLTGKQARYLFLLRSTAFDLSYDGANFLFTVVGFGHGVGMSQYGANVMAHGGADYASILAHYYPGTTLSHISDAAP